jgi:iron(III) transport system ATP-binding protein
MAGPLQAVMPAKNPDGADARGGSLELKGVSKAFGRVWAVRDVDLGVPQGELVCLLGPSGCGKTTLLRLIAGFERPTRGSIVYNGEAIETLPPQARNFGIVFQSYALFPHLTVAQNIAFGLENLRMPRPQVRARVQELLHLTDLSESAGKRPPELSGGQQQRTAIARALAPNPDILLLDEPLSALDARIRVRLRGEIRRIQRGLGITMIYVTHDQEEALSLADRVVVMEAGLVRQVGLPAEIYHSPRDPFVADFVGAANILPCRLDAGPPPTAWFGRHRLSLPETFEARSGPASLGIRPERARVLFGESAGTGPNWVPARVEGITFLGAIVRVHAEVDGCPVQVDVAQHLPDAGRTAGGSLVWIQLPPEALMVFPTATPGGAGDPT